MKAKGKSKKAKGRPQTTLIKIWLPLTFAFYLFTFDFSLQNYPAVSGSACDALAVEVFQEWDGVFARNPCEVFESRNVNQTLRLVLASVVAQTFGELVERFAVKVVFTAYAH